MGSIIVDYLFFQKGLELPADYEIVVEEGHLALETINGLGAYPVLYGQLSTAESLRLLGAALTS